MCLLSNLFLPMMGNERIIVHPIMSRCTIIAFALDLQCTSKQLSAQFKDYLMVNI